MVLIVLLFFNFNVSSCMYVSGVPGTGKTATIHEVAENLKAEAAEGNLPHFNFVEVNGMRLTNPCHVYSSIWKVSTDSISILLLPYNTEII